MTLVLNRRTDRARRKELRHGMPSTEWVLLGKIRNKQLNNYKFRRQYGIGPYVVDFYCPKVKLIVEIDGSSHATTVAHENDKAREAYFSSLGFKILRFSNQQVKNSLNRVLNDISKVLLGN